MNLKDNIFFDSHYDLLTWLYCCYLNKNEDKSRKLCSNLGKHNITSGIFNLYFMPIDDMEKELHPKYWDSSKTVTQMFEIATKEFKKYAPVDVDALFSIEGCTYLEISELDELYKLGLRSILPVWNDTNKYGAGSWDDKNGLTDKGRQLILKAVALGIAIDVSHANSQTFDDIISLIKLCKIENLNPIIMASHSNAQALSPRVRNLTDKQLQQLKEVEGYVGVISNVNFLTEKKGLDLRLQVDYENAQNSLEDSYIKQIKHVANIVGIDKMFLASDDMDFLKEIDPDYGKLSLFPYEQLKDRTNQLLEKHFTPTEIEQLTYQNGRQLVKKLNGPFQKEKSR